MLTLEEAKQIADRFWYQFVMYHRDHCVGCGLRNEDEQWYLVVFLINPLDGEFQLPDRFENLPIITEVTGRFIAGG